MESPLKWQTRVVSCFQRADQPGLPPNPPGFAVGSVEGRVAIQYVKEENKSSNFSFKCHRKDPPAPAPGQTQREPHQLFCVNAISFHPIQGTFSTAGSDGTINFWDKDSKTRLKCEHSFLPCPHDLLGADLSFHGIAFEAKAGPISATAFNQNGNIFAYAGEWLRDEA